MCITLQKIIILLFIALWESEKERMICATLRQHYIDVVTSGMMSILGSSRHAAAAAMCAIYDAEKVDERALLLG